MSKGKWQIDLGLTTYPQTLEFSKELVRLAREHPQQEKMLSACAAVVLAAALKQGIDHWLKFKAKEMYREENVRPESTPFGKLLERGVTFESQMSLPELITANRYGINPRSPLKRALQDLIKLRNRLVHIEDEVVSLTEESSGVFWKDNQIRIEDIKRFLPNNPWTTVGLHDVERFDEAVRTYLREVIEQAPSQIPEEELKLLVPRDSGDTTPNS